MKTCPICENDVDKCQCTNEQESNFKLVQEFHRKMGVIRGRDGKVAYDEFLLYKRLITEEYLETMDAAEAFDLRFGRPSKPVELIDGLIDLLYVTYGMLNVLGVDADKMFRIVHKHNMMKTPRRNEYGKIKKPKGFIEPHDEIAKQLKNDWKLL